MAAKIEVAIVGAGPLGLMAALSFARLDASVHLIGPKAKQDGRTTAILSDGIELLREIGVWAQLEAQTAPLKIMRLVDGSKRLIRSPEISFEASEVGLEAFGHNIKNNDLLAILQEAVTGNEHIVWHEQHLQTCDLTSSTGPELQLEDGRQITCDLVIGADGRNSLIRQNANIKSKSWSYPQTALVLNLAHSKPHNGVSTEFHTETGPFTLVPLPGNCSSLVWVENPKTAEDLLATDTNTLAREIERKSQFLLGDITIEREPMAYPLSGLSADIYGKGQAILIGESAHVFPPIGAQGMNLGIRDLRDALKHCRPEKLSKSVSECVNAFAKSRQLDIKARTAAVDVLNRSLLTGILPVHLAKGIGVYALNKLPIARKTIMSIGLGANKNRTQRSQIR